MLLQSKTKTKIILIIVIIYIFIIQLSQLEEAKNALCEANILNNKAPEVWAYLSLICLRTNKPLEAEKAYK